ncbi:DUF423 domain-containing protein [Cochleicola gelatinilyticus]|uniref:DUF423 domain-containing protein n=1 Tax=Cochleicola gelatinilyticus TaxID=1763537 RepID=A0A167ISL1_9FLAO|nr:DUF423 domain-containing protein [Cochleicola gelatinilyticus]OAB79975.1 hypothetical protein ULVI_04345 [Cochleicola gelatinilyticus]
MKNYDKKIVVTASVLAAVTIAIGAFGAHGLKNLVDGNALLSFETGVRYQMYHVLALLVLGFATAIPKRLRKTVFLFFVLGMICFSGSIYLLALKTILPFDPTVIAFVTPLGGLFFIIGWLRLAYGMFSLKMT